MKTLFSGKRFPLSVLSALLITPTLALANEPVVFASYGGVWADTIKEVCGVPFEKETGIPVRMVATDNSIAQIRIQQMTRNVQWDIAPTEGDAVIIATENDWLEPLDWSYIDPENKIADVGRMPTAIGAVAYSVAIAYRTDKVPSGKTFTGWKDFWNVEEFPGPRSLRNTPVENLEFALIADGVETGKVYDVLATKEGMDRAFKKMDEIKEHITVWWSSGQQPPQMLATGNVYYATTFNGRVAPLQADGVPVDIAWNGAAIEMSNYSIQKNAKNKEGALKFIKFCWNNPERLAQIAKKLPYSSFNEEMYEYLDPEYAKKLPTHPDNVSKQFHYNAEFWAKNRKAIQARWDRWRLN